MSRLHYKETWFLRLHLTHSSRIRALSTDTTRVMERPDSVAPIEKQIGAENGKFYHVRFPGIFSLKWGFESGRGNCLKGTGGH